MSLPDIRSADQIEPADVQWLWPGWLPLGKLVVLDGAPEVGKSTLMSDLAAKLSRGQLGGPPSATLFVTVEEAAADSIVPRLIAAGADRSKVHVWRPADDFTVPDKVDRLAEAIGSTGARLVVLDPVSDFLGVSMTDEQSVRRALRALARLAEATGCTVLCIRHLRKQEGGPAIYRGLGSVGVVAAARVVWLLGHHPRGEGRRVLAVTKSNVGERPVARAFRLTDRRIEWLAEETWMAAEDVRPTGEPSQAEWLRTQLASGPKKMKRLVAEARVLGMSQRTLERAKEALQIVSKRYYEAWYWCLPGQDPRSRFSSLRPLDEIDPEKEAVLEPIPPEERLGPVDDGPVLVREGLSERQILRQARKALEGELRARKRETFPPRPPSPKEGEGGVGRSGTSHPLPGPRCPAPPSPSLGEGGRGGEGHPGPPGSRRFDPAPAGYLEVVVRVDPGDPKCVANLVERLGQLVETVQSWTSDTAKLDWAPDWTGPVGDGLVRLVFAPRGVPPDRLARLAGWAKEAIPECESARLAA
jgi:AAA domain